MKVLTVTDLFCGAGGFSEGFRQMGFKIAAAVDYWKPAVDTHKLNHPESETILKDILELNMPKKIDKFIPDTDVIIGSPPCVSFSGSNKAGKADKSLGIKLIEAQLKIIAWKKNRGFLKYWILENVPNTIKYVKDRYTWKELNLPGNGPDLEIPKKEILNAAEYGAPQTRRRFFCGDYPNPEKTHDEKDFVTMKKVFESLKPPLSCYKGKIIDPVYGFEIKSDRLTDHFYDSSVPEFEWRNAKRLKEDHGFMGKMAFPEDLNRPSRTVMATMSASTREAMIFKNFDKDGNVHGYRMPTIREIATFMSFPITYQFEAKGLSSKYRLVGNAVCPKISAALAKAIAKEEKMAIPRSFIALNSVTPSFLLNGTCQKKKVPNPRRYGSKFAMHIPYLKSGNLRIELNNKSSDFKKKKIVWEAVLHHGTGKGARLYKVKKNDIRDMLKCVNGFDGFVRDLEKKFGRMDLKSNKLYEEYLDNDFNKGPEMHMEIMRNVIDRHFPEDRFGSILIENTKRKIDVKKDEIPLRILAGTFALNYYVDKIMG